MQQWPHSLVRHLVTKYSCDLNARDKDGDTPFTCVGFGGSVECLELLIDELHCNINTKGDDGRTILHNACSYGHSSLVRHLVTKYSCDLNARNNDGDTPFTCVGLGGSVECLELLINDFHSDINTKACNNSHTSLVRHLVTNYSCNLNARDNDADTPFLYAGLGGSVECLELLIQ